MTDQVSRAIGRRLRAIRKQRGLSLEDVERLSEGRWSASAVGAYERGFRKLTVDRLRDLAEFYGVPLPLVLSSLPEPDKTHSPSRVVLDVKRLETAGPELAPLLRMVKAIQAERREHDSNFIAIRHSDIQSAALMFGETEEHLIARLRARKILVDLDHSPSDKEAGDDSLDSLEEDSLETEAG